MTDPSLASWLASIPKAEVHVHLEGAIQPATLLRLARRRGISLPADDEEGLARWFRFRDFEHFVEVYITCSSCLCEPEDFHLLAMDFVAEQARQNVTYSEAHFTISTHIAQGGDPVGIRQALAEATTEGWRRYGSRLRLIPDIVRNMEVERADRTLEWAIETDRQYPGLIAAFGISGIEAGYSNEPFVEHFEAAGRAGLRLVAHAGEHGGPASIRSALDRLGAERIDHGVRAVDEPELVAELARRRVPLGVCPSSNVALGVFPDLASHSFETLRGARVHVTVNSDDPPFFDTTLSDEYLRLAAQFGYGREQLAELVEAGWQAAFLSDEERRKLSTQPAQPVET